MFVFRASNILRRAMAAIPSHKALKFSHLPALSTAALKQPLHPLPEQYPGLVWSDTPSEPNAGSGNEEEALKKPQGPTEDDLRGLSDIVHRSTVQFLTAPPDYRILDRDLVFEDRIRNKKCVGGIYFVQQLSYLKIWLHIKFMYCRVSVTSVAIDVEEARFQHKWQIHGMGVLKTMLNYVPKKLYKRKNMEEFAPLYTAGISTYYVNDQSKIVHIIVDDREIDRDRQTVVKSTVEQVKEKMAKLKKDTVPAPAMFKKVQEEKWRFFSHEIWSFFVIFFLEKRADFKLFKLFLANQ